MEEGRKNSHQETVTSVRSQPETTQAPACGWTFISYHYVHWWEASQQVFGGQQRRHKGVPENGTGSEGNESLALGAQRLEAPRVPYAGPME